MVDPDNRQGEIGFIFDPAHQGHGYATEAARALVAHAFEHYGLHRVYGRLEPRNVASARVLEKLGMRREAHLIENEWVKGEWQSEAVYALLAREWAAASARAAERVRRAQPALELARRHRAGEVVALDLVAAPQAEQRAGLGAVDALGDHAHAEPAPEVHQRVHDRGVALVVGDAHDERAVDLEHVDVQLLEVGEPGVAGAEVVERGGDADRAQADEHVDGALDVGHDDVLRHLDLEPVGREAMVVEQPLDLRRQAEVEQVGRAEVDGDAEVAAAQAQAPDLVERAVEHERGQRAREPALLDQRQEVHGPEQPALRVLPAHERLDAAHVAAAQLGLRLVVEDELAGLERRAELADQREPLAAVAVAAGEVDLVAGAHALGLVHGDVGALQQPHRVLARGSGRARCRRWRRCGRGCRRPRTTPRAPRAAAGRRCWPSPRRRAGG